MLLSFLFISEFALKFDVDTGKHEDGCFRSFVMGQLFLQGLFKTIHTKFST